MFAKHPIIGYNSHMTTPLEREEFIEQSYFFRVFRERLAENMAAQEILERIHEEILTTTRLPLAIQFLSTELKHAGLLATGFARLPHYFTAFQAFVIGQAEKENSRFTMPVALLVLEREAHYKASGSTPSGLFVFQFETISRNRLGYDDGLRAMARDPMYDDHWQHYLTMVRKQVGTIDFADLVYLRSELYVLEQRRTNPDYEPPSPPLYGEKEGKIAKASRGRDPLFLFAALQRQLGYPEVPRPRPKDDLSSRFEMFLTKFREMEARIRLLESEARGHVDLSQFGKPEFLDKDDDDDKQ